MAEKSKMMPLRAWPESERPRERLFRYGVASLSNAELLSLFVRSGTPGVNARDLSIRLLKQWGGLSALSRRAPCELLEFPGLGPAKVSSLSAAFEIGNRVLAEELQSGPRITTASDLFRFCQQSLRGAREEIFQAALLNARNELIKVITLARGDAMQVLVSIPQVLRQLISESCAAVIFIHNHPSGDVTPSAEDETLTRRLVAACQAVELTLHDHLIVGDQTYFSFSEAGLME